MNNSIHNAIKTEYEKKQKAAFDDQMQRMSAAFSKIPGLEEVCKEIHRSGLKYNKMILLGNTPADKAVSELQAKIDGLKAEKERLLTRFGYPVNYLEVSYSCGKCKDTGFVEVNGIVEKCACYKQRLIDHLYNQSNLRMTEKENFSNFDESLYPDVVDEKKYGLKISPRENILKIRERCQKFIENFDSPDEKNLFFSGPTGVGKTYMSNCIAMELLNSGRTVLYQTAPVLFNVINEYKTRTFKDEDLQDPSYNNIFEVELLIIDDLGTESATSARYAELLTILNTRQAYNLSRPCKTILSTNIGVKELYGYYDERIASRIIGCFDMFRFIGEDIRTLKKFNRKFS